MTSQKPPQEINPFLKKTFFMSLVISLVGYVGTITQNNTCPAMKLTKTYYSISMIQPNNPDCFCPLYQGTATQSSLFLVQSMILYFFHFELVGQWWHSSKKSTPAKPGLIWTLLFILSQMYHDNCQQEKVSQTNDGQGNKSFYESRVYWHRSILMHQKPVSRQ